ncbi:MAG: transcriptional regulator, CdaR family [Acidimicrobiales bacterium]|nr:transcriptional regulator, CdaR family [Acidimicrobiales bacterium]
MSEDPSSHALLRRQLSAFRALHVLAMVMIGLGDEHELLRLAVTAVPSLCRGHALALYLDGEWRSEGGLDLPDHRSELEAQIKGLGCCGGLVEVPGSTWARAYPLTSVLASHLVVTAASEPAQDEQFVLAALGRQLGVSLTNARLHREERASAADLGSANVALEQSMAELRRTLDIHRRLMGAAAAGDGREGIAGAVHELTGHAVAIEDPYGNLTAWVGPDRPDPYPRASPEHRAELLARVMTAGHPVRHGGNIVAVARRDDEAVGLIALVDPDDTTGEADRAALEHGATVLAVELTHLRRLADAELGRRRDLVEELLVGTDARSARERALVLGYDLERRHWVVVVERPPRTIGAEDFLQAVRRAARDTGAGSLLVSRADAVVMLAFSDRDWPGLEAAIARGSGVDCRMGVGGACEDVPQFPRSLHEAQLALRLQQATAAGERVTVFEDLGVYRVLAEVADAGMVEAFARRWLGPLLDYDEAKGAQLVESLSGYLESGGSYDTATARLSVHRSTLRYRLQRVHDLSGHDLGDPDTRFNLQLATRACHILRAMREVGG